MKTIVLTWEDMVGKTTTEIVEEVKIKSRKIDPSEVAYCAVCGSLLDPKDDDRWYDLHCWDCTGRELVEMEDQS